MTRGDRRRGASGTWRAAAAGVMGFLLLPSVPSLVPSTGALPGSGTAAAENAAPKLTFYPSFQLRFVDGQARNYFFSQAQVVNVSGAPMKDLVLRQTFPEGFTPRLLSADSQTFFKRPEGFSETVENGVYVVRMPELRLAEALLLTVDLTYQGRPAAVTIPGIEVEYSQDGQPNKDKGAELTWDLSKYTRYSGSLREFIKRYAGLDMTIPNSREDWGFSNLVARAAGRPATGVVEIESEQTGRTRFSLQAGVPGSLRQLVLFRRPFDPARQPKANDEARRLALDQVQATADFMLDGDNMSIQKKKVGRWDAWVADTTWRDRVKDRLGEGPARCYIFADEKGTSQYIITISAQGRGAGPGKADVPNPAREQELMSELEGIVSSLRIL